MNFLSVTAYLLNNFKKYFILLMRPDQIMKKPEILIIDDNEDILLALKLLLKENNYNSVIEKNPSNIPELMNKTDFDVIILDMNFAKEATDGKEGVFWLKKILEIDPNSIVILITAFGDIDLAVSAVKDGASDFILKPWQNEKLLSTLSISLNLRNSLIEVDKLKSQQKQLIHDSGNKFQEIIGGNKAMKDIMSLVMKVAKTDANVLILGENGTGKELIARALHRNSLRADMIFSSVDMGSISETLFESELFGHVKGAFTDAKENRTGRFENASGGTLFLDEIGNLSMQMQSKLLNALENHEVIPVGSNKPKKIDVRLICATNEDIHKIVKEKVFRQDLLYRINTIEIIVPPLRERKEDIPLLFEYFSLIFYQKYKTKPKTVPREVIRFLEEYSWPGNIRELKHATERAIIISDTNTFTISDFMFQENNKSEDDNFSTNYNLDYIEKKTILKVVQKNNGNISMSADELGLTRAALYRRIEKYDLKELQN
jgi:two-component system, NtrC family, response regulator HydG